MTRPAALAALTLIVLVGFALRVFRLNAVPFRGDEAFAAQYWAGQPLSVTLATIATREPHPPLTYAMFRGWALIAGINEFTLRLLPALGNLIGIPAIFAIGCRLIGRNVGMVAALLWALNPYQIWHAQDARNYALWAGLSAMSAWLALRAVCVGRRRDWLLYVVVSAVTAFVFYAELLMLAGISLYVVVRRWRQWSLLARWFAVQAVLVGSVLLTFWLLQGRLFASGSYGGTIGSANVPALWAFLTALAFGQDTLPQPIGASVWPFLLALLVAGLLVAWWKFRKLGLFLVTAGVFPVLLLLALSLRADILHPRYVLPVTTAYLLAFASIVVWAYDHAGNWRLLRLGAAVLLGGWLAVSSLSLYNYYFVPDYTKSADWPALTRYLRSRVAPDDLVIQTGVDAAFGYYYDAPAEDIGLPANPQQSVSDITATLLASRDTYQSIWAVGRTFPDWPNAGVVERWLHDNMQEVRATQIDGLPIQQFMPWEVRGDEIKATSLASFEGLADLVSVRVLLPPEPTGELKVWLYWRARGTSYVPLKIFVHLLGSTNPATGTPLWTQDDQYPQDSRISTATWTAGEVYRDVYTLPLASVAAGDYRLVVGFYDPQMNRRLIVNGSDSFSFAQIALP